MNIPYAFKKCSKCGKIKVVSKANFSKSKSCKGGFRSSCRECHSKQVMKRYNDNDEYREEQKEKNRKRFNEKYNNNDEYRKEIRKKQNEKYNNNDEWRENYLNKRKEKRASDEEYREKINKKNREYHKEKYANDKEWKKRRNENFKKWSKNNPENEFNRANKRRSKLENQGRGITKEQYIECNNWFDWKCAYSGENLKKSKDTYGRTLDHILAIDNNGMNEIWNLVPMRLGYNASKRNRIDTLTWYKEQEYFDIERLNKIVEWQIYAYEKWGGEEFGELILITDLI